MKRGCFLGFVSLILFSFSAQALIDSDYLPNNTQFRDDIPSPSQVIGAPVGEWHVRHDQLVEYMRILAAKSDRVSILETGRSHENRPLLLLTFSSAKNQQNLASIRQQHVSSFGQKSAPDQPLVLWMGYSVHGDESSGANAALLIAYYLAAAKGEAVEALLDNNVVLMEPSINPDGLARFAQWANGNRGQQLVADPNHREHQQPWPSGRTNHYLFDLNRDWLLLTHPESQARIAQFHRWRPHVLTDFHEMGTNSSYFFQPGIASRNNPWTPARNTELTAELAKFHAAALDKTKQLYFTQEAYDDFYYGKGSTYPDAQGSIGILFEQASSRGHKQESIHGVLNFSDTIQNQVTTSLSTFTGAQANKAALLAYPEQFTAQTNKLIKDDKTVGYLLSESQDASRFAQLKSILQQHQIKFSYLDKEVSVDDTVYQPLSSIFVPLNQPQYRLVKSLFSERKSFNDNSFYDVSSWNLPLAFNIQYSPVERKLWRNIPVNDEQNASAKQLTAIDGKDAYAFGFSWQDSNAPKLLYRLLAGGVKVKIAGSDFAALTTQGNISFTAGSVLIPLALKQPDNLESLLNEGAAQSEIKIWSILSGLTAQGIDIGSRDMHGLKTPQVLLVGGEGTSQYEVGEAWHYLDTVVEMPVTMTDLSRLPRLDLTRYSHIIWVSGNYADVPEKTVRTLEKWLSAGGVMIGQRTGAKWLADKDWLKASFFSQDEIKRAFSTTDLNYADRNQLAAKRRIAGAVFDTQLDLSHPLTFGFTRSHLPSFKNSTVVMRVPKTPFVTVGRYTSTPLMSGYAADELQALVSKSASIVANSVGKGKVIAFVDDPNFRGYWRGTRRLLSNAIFMSNLIATDQP
ncbi:M14 metallopeptidase family protein [Paraglaciecola sp. L1A13]|uniref:M14 metallopeptidase family protein n=1 Tax=Paraglaciecola sp. L1A13 TaxID=2686359 RepID=UPI00131D508B|nr:M14 metallopeptidase family protein [Paraglaciecola sp. L1A13]